MCVTRLYRVFRFAALFPRPVLENSEMNVTIDYMMIIGKYFKTPRDYINTMRVSKKYQQLVLMYKFNPIGETDLFENMQTQHFYRKLDFLTVVPRMYKYVYWGTYTRKLESAVKKVNRRKYICSQYEETHFVKDRLVSKNIDHRHIMELLHGLPFRCGRMIYDSTATAFTDGIPKYTGMAIQICYDDENNSVAFLRGYNPDSIYADIVPSLNRVTYYDSISDIKVFRQDNKNMSISSNRDETSINFITNTELKFTIGRDKQGRYVMKITNSGFTYKELSSLMFPAGILSRSNPALIKFNIKRYAIYSVDSTIDDAYYADLMQRAYGRAFTVLLDTWTVPFGVDYNIGYVRYIDFDDHGNSIMFNVLPTQVILTVSIGGVVRNIKPLCDMQSVVMNLNDRSDNLYTRYNFYTNAFAAYYNTVWSDIIYPLDRFFYSRRLVCTNKFTRCSCVKHNSYFLRVRNRKFVNY